MHNMVKAKTDPPAMVAMASTVWPTETGIKVSWLVRAFEGDHK